MIIQHTKPENVSQAKEKNETSKCELSFAKSLHGQVCLARIGLD